MDTERQPRVPVAQSLWVYAVPGLGEVDDTTLEDCVAKANGSGVNFRRIRIEFAPLGSETAPSGEMRRRFMARSLDRWRDDR